MFTSFEDIDVALGEGRPLRSSARRFVRH
uniref:Uncharacterized protein n=1 Tax=Perkinsus marinus TaxID=31276 RepID=A7YXQ4_9ALVE|nr:unknown [Perkinsus marinus]